MLSYLYSLLYEVLRWRENVVSEAIILIIYYPKRERILLLWIMPGYFPLSIPPSPPSINIISEISFTIISLSSTDKLFMEFRFSLNYILDLVFHHLPVPSSSFSYFLYFWSLWTVGSLSSLFSFIYVFI